MDAHTFTRLAGLLALTAATTGLVACRASERASVVISQEPTAVTVAAVTATDGSERLEAGGVVAAPESATVSSRIVAAKAGDRVRAGDVLITLDAADLSERVQQARAGALAAEKSLVQARTTRSVAEAEHRLASAWQTRIVTLHTKNAATDQELDEAEARLTTAAARLAGADAEIDAADAQLTSARAGVSVAAATESFTTVRAPFDGVVSERFTDPGNLAAPGVPLLRVESDGARRVIARIDEARAPFVHTGDRVTVEIDARDRPAAGVEDLEGVVAEVARAIGSDQRAFAIKVTLPRAVTARSGSFARVVFRGERRRQVLVPAAAVQQHGQVSSVYVVENGIARLRVIQAGPSSSDALEVLSGLDPGESVVVAGLTRLTDGARVTVGASPTRTGSSP
jgi:RND family efflux transporter MFP subunit